MYMNVRNRIPCMRSMVRMLAMASLAVVVAACGSSSSKTKKDQIKYEIRKVESETRVYNIYIPASLHGLSEVEVFPQVSGIIREVNFKNIIIRASEKGEILRLRDLAEVELGARAYDFRTNISGKPGVMFYVKQAPGANATKVNAEINKVLAEVEKRLPAGLEFKLLETSDDFLYASMYNVVETLIVAIILVVLVVYFFLQDFRATLIPSITNRHLCHRQDSRLLAEPADALCLSACHRYGGR